MKNELFVTQKVFNPKLSWKAVRISGYCIDGDKWEGIYLVKETKFDKIVITDRNGEQYRLHMENFETGELLTLTVLEED
ncbi:hypothetical protein AB3N02_13990 [Priestia aryabhattai]|uniref:hypothetical protein n=1 Tax=Priestia aryabhattai TaxID=412384 RepID=UPI0039A06743